MTRRSLRPQGPVRVDCTLVLLERDQGLKAARRDVCSEVADFIRRDASLIGCSSLRSGMYQMRGIGWPARSIDQRGAWSGSAASRGAGVCCPSSDPRLPGRHPSKAVVSNERHRLELAVFVADVERLALILGVVLATEIPVITAELKGRCRNSACVAIGDLLLTITDTGSVTHAELTVQVPDLAEVHTRLQAVEPSTRLMMLDGRLTVALIFDSFGLFIVGE